ncbi:MAG: hypothetical protein GY804_06480 [Alphaproteobacteria bacterium]|nr:hypothetical protein [Alphaproteobacteria bacterium]
MTNIKHIKTQSGRSMTEMLGVLAIVGVLSIGALAGYSQAMTTHKINLAVKEIHRYILQTKELYANKSNYADISNDLIKKAGIFNQLANNGTPINVYNKPIYMEESNTFGASYFRLSYYIDKDEECQKILTSGLDQKIGQDLGKLYINASATNSFQWNDSGTYKFPITIDEAISICAGINYIAFHIK